MHFNWDMVVPVLFQLYICLAVLNRTRFLNREIFIITPETKCLLTALEHKFISRPYEAAASWNLLFPWFWKTTEHTEQWWDRYTERKRGKKKKKKRRKWAGICSLNCPSTRRKLITQRGTHRTCRNAHCVLSIFLGVLGRMKEEEGKTRQQIYFPRKCISFGWFFKLYFVGPLSKGIYEGAHAKESSVDLGTEKAQKVEKPV